jgi:hypothetical protein
MMCIDNLAALLLATNVRIVAIIQIAKNEKRCFSNNEI